MEGIPNLLVDPFGLEIILEDEDCFSDEKAGGRHYYNDFHSVIEKPAYIINLPSSSPPERYYFRTIGWEISLLIRSQLIGKEWRANHCEVDPADDHIKKLAEKGQIITVDPAA
jgi:hypothetical protein